MIDRHLLGDVGFAVLLAVPTLALARPQVAIPQDHSAAVTQMVDKAAFAERSPVERRFSLVG